MTRCWRTAEAEGDWPGSCLHGCAANIGATAVQSGAGSPESTLRKPNHGHCALSLELTQLLVEDHRGRQAEVSGRITRPVDCGSGSACRRGTIVVSCRRGTKGADRIRTTQSTTTDHRQGTPMTVA